MSKVQEIRADYDKHTITVYQAYNKQIALPAIANNRFEAPFSFNRMTWIKPSYLWLMSRSSWGTKSNQDYILGIQLRRPAWERALSLGVLTHPDKKVYKSGAAWEAAFENAKVHIQWDPERSLKNAKLNIRTIQVGIGSALIEEYNQEWIKNIIDLTPLTRKIHKFKKQGDYAAAKKLLPQEKKYKLSQALAGRIGVY